MGWDIYNIDLSKEDLLSRLALFSNSKRTKRGK